MNLENQQTLFVERNLGGRPRKEEQQKDGIRLPKQQPRDIGEVVITIDGIPYYAFNGSKQHIIGYANPGDDYKPYKIFSCRRNGTWRELRLTKMQSSNYLLVNIYRSQLYHRVIAEQYIERTEYVDGEVYEVDHYDGDVMNNQVSNLRWITHSENCRNKNQKGKKLQKKVKIEYLTQQLSFNRIGNWSLRSEGYIYSYETKGIYSVSRGTSDVIYTRICETGDDSTNSLNLQLLNGESTTFYKPKLTRYLDAMYELSERFKNTDIDGIYRPDRVCRICDTIMDKIQLGMIMTDKNIYDRFRVVYNIVAEGGNINQLDETYDYELIEEIRTCGFGKASFEEIYPLDYLICVDERLNFDEHGGFKLNDLIFPGYKMTDRKRIKRLQKVECEN